MSHTPLTCTYTASDVTQSVWFCRMREKDGAEEEVRDGDTRGGESDGSSLVSTTMTMAAADDVTWTCMSTDISF